MSVTEHFFDNRDALANGLADLIIENAKASPYLFVSGGSTPKALFKRLSQDADKLSEVEINLVDERWVPAEHADSNAKLVADNLKAGQFKPLYLGTSPEADCKAANERLVTYGDFGTLILGMGGDSHTASLFPGLAETDAAFKADAPLVVVTNPTTAPHARVGLSSNGIKKARTLILHIEGADKRDVYERAKTADFPISRVMNDPDNNLHVYWAP